MSVKFVKKAGQWCVTYYEKGEKKTIQKQMWFASDEEQLAIKFDKEQREGEH